MIDPNTGNFAKSNDPSTWASFELATELTKYYKNYGLAFVLTSGITFVDIDHCIDEKGNINDVAKDLLNMISETYAEKSVSGTGIHLLAKGNLLEKYKRRNDSLGIEMYDTKRFMCITGRTIFDRKEILPRQNEIIQASIKFMSPIVERANMNFEDLNLSDNEVINKIMKSKTGIRFRSLMNGDLTGYPSHSNADMALVNMIGFWTQDMNQIDRIFRNSGLMREKWDKMIGNQTYGQYTINNMLRTRKETIHDFKPSL